MSECEDAPLQQVFRGQTPVDFFRYHLEHDKCIDYLKLASRCETVNMFNRLHIDLENICSPLEIVEIQKAKHGEPTREWLDHLLSWAPTLFETPQRYKRRAISWPMMLYEDPEQDVHEKSLLVAFADDTRRLMLPISVFLQYVDSRYWDVVVLKRRLFSYLHGLDEVSTDFHGVIERVENAVSPTQYRRVITLGTSGGGFPALWAAMLMRASRGISICGCPPRSLSPSLEVLRAPHDVDLCYVYGGAQDQDRRSALSLLALFGGRLCPVPDVDEHVLLYHLMMYHQLGEFLYEILSLKGPTSIDELARRHPLPRVQALRTALATSEQDRADRLDVIHRLDAEVQALRTAST
jgi:hypothetical protein